MQSLAQFFQYLHDVDFPYVVLRNWEHLPHSHTTKGHGDLDILVYDLKHFRELFPDILPVYPHPRIMHKATIDGVNVYIDVRYVGDGYYPLAFQQAMLNTREYNQNGFFTPDPVHFRLALAYHAVHHKNCNNYERWLGEATIPELLDALKKSNIGYCVPDDRSVGSFNQYFKGATSVVSKDGKKVVKSQTSYNGYSLIDREYRILTAIKSKHFPKAISFEGDTIEIEDCGEGLRVEKLPPDWKAQLVQIVKDLKQNRVTHRDIKPDNLLVKDGVIKLIDFGWAKLDDDEDDSPPSCLGYPYKPSWGFDDNFSMMKVIKEFEYKLEESKCES